MIFISDIIFLKLANYMYVGFCRDEFVVEKGIPNPF